MSDSEVPPTISPETGEPDQGGRVPARVPPPAIYRWKKGQSGNPKGRPKGSGKRSIIRKEIQAAADLTLAGTAKRLLNRNSDKITLEVLRIALQPSIEVISENKKTGAKTVKIVDPAAKVKCLLACFERIVPALKVVELKDTGETRKPSEMTDEEIVQMMERMVTLAQGGERLDG